MNRREALKNSAFLAGCGLSAGTIAAVISGCQSEPKPYADSFLGNDIVELLGEIVETIIPTTDTPGAKAAGIHTWMDQAVKDNFTTDEQDQFKMALADIRKSGFMKMSVEEREEHLLGIEVPESETNPYEVLKGMTCQGFFTSEIGATEVLAFDPIPGEWRGCIDYSEVGKAWSIDS